MSSSVTTQPDRLTAVLSRSYRIDRELGAGGMATVYLARDLRHDRDVAIKVLHPDLGAALGAERFLAEIKVTAKLQHPHILPLLDSGVADGLLYYVMPYVRGETLRARLERGGALPVAAALPLLRIVLQALAAAHAQGVVHRDVKPENVLLSGDSAIVADFGVAKALGNVTRTGPGVGLTQAGTSVGTPAYMAPEQAAGDAATDHRADLYAWGVLAHEMLAGAHPFARHVTPQAMFAAHLTEAPPALVAPAGPVPDGVRALVARCLAKDPGQRPASAESALAALADLTTPTATPSARAEAGPRGARRRWGVAGAVLLLVVMGGALLARRSVTAPPPRSVAVLPFDAGADTANAYVADGLAAELTTKLAKIADLQVRAYSSSKMLRGARAAEAARQLGVASVVVAEVRRAADRLRVNASLVSAGDERVLWSESFDGADRDQFALQDRIAAAIARALQVTLSAAGSGAGNGGRAVDPIAHDLVQRARYLADQLTPQALTQAVMLARQAVERDSTYAEAWAALFDVYVKQADDALPGAAVLPQMQQVVRRLAVLEPDAPRTNAMTGATLAWYARDTVAGERALQAALAADSTDANALTVSGVFALPRDPRRAGELIARSVRANPMALIALYVSIVVPPVFDVLPGDSTRAMCARLRLTVASLGDQCEAIRLVRTGQAAEGRRRMRAADTTALGGSGWAWAVHTAAVVGDTALVRTLLARVDEESRRTYVREDFPAIAAAMIGDRAAALRWTYRAFASRASGATLALHWAQRVAAGDARELARLDSAYAAR
jgi:serine/threonine-protein kinase